MVRLQLQFPIIALVNDKINAGFSKDRIAISPVEIRKWGGVMEQKTSLAVLNGFTPEQITQFLDTSPLFQRDWQETDSEGNPVYTLKTEALRKIKPYPDIPFCLFVAWDPVLNYPMELIEASGLLPVLEGPEE